MYGYAIKRLNLMITLRRQIILNFPVFLPFSNGYSRLEFAGQCPNAGSNNGITKTLDQLVINHLVALLLDVPRELEREATSFLR